MEKLCFFTKFNIDFEKCKIQCYQKKTKKNRKIKIF